MNIKTISKRTVLIGLCAILVLGLGVVLLSPLGRGLRGGITRRIRLVSNIGEAIWDGRSISRDDDFTNIVFLHHSVGANLISQGGVRERFAENGYEFWDHGYNGQGLVRPDGKSAGYNYNIPGDNTNPDGLAHIFSQQYYSWPFNAFSGLMQHEVIVFKSCFPVSYITSDSQLEQYKHHYLQMREMMDQYPDQIFVVVTPPPLNPPHTDLEIAARARAFAEWLKSDEFLAGHSNVFTFDLFDHLAEDDPTAPDYSMLREEYRREASDPHPNEVANETIGPLFADFVIGAIETYRARVNSVTE